MYVGLHERVYRYPRRVAFFQLEPLPHIWGGHAHIRKRMEDPPWVKPLHRRCLMEGGADSKLDLGCVAAHGMFACDRSGCFTMMPEGKPSTAFLFELIAHDLQSSATVPMIDIRAYAKWLGVEKKNELFFLMTPNWHLSPGS